MPASKGHGRAYTPVTIIQGRTESGREKWSVTEDQKTVTEVTSSTSAKIMDDAVRKYSRALRRLAKR